MSNALHRSFVAASLLGAASSLAAQPTPTSSNLFDGYYFESLAGINRGVDAMDYENGMIVTAWGQVSLVDAADVLNPAHLDSFGGNLNDNDAEIEGDRAYVFETDNSSTNRLLVFDAAIPTSVTQAGSLSITESRIHAMGDVVFLWDQAGSTVRVVDASNPAAMSVVSTIATPEPVQAALAEGGRLYLHQRDASGNNSLAVYNVSSPQAPSLLGTLPLPDAMTGLDVRGDLVAVAVSETAPAAADPSLVVINTADPASPSTLATVSLIEDGQVQCLGDRAIVVNSTAARVRLTLVDLSDPASPVRRGFMSLTAESVPALGASHIAVLRDRGIDFLSLDDPQFTRPSPVVATVPGTSGAAQVRVSGDLALLANPSVGLQIVQLSQTSPPALVGQYAFSGARAVFAEPGRAHVYSPSLDEIVTLDTTDPTNPTLLSTVSIPGAFTRLLVIGQTYYLGASGGLTIIDASTASPVVTTWTDHEIVDMTLHGGLISAVGNNQMFLLQPNAAGVVPHASITIPGRPNRTSLAIRTDGDTAYVSLTDDGFATVDLTDTTNPALLTTRNGSQRFSGPGAIVNGLWVFNDNDFGFKVFDVSDPTDPRMVGSHYLVNGATKDMDAFGELALLARGNAGLQYFRAVPSVPPDPCPADINGDGLLDNGDIGAFVALFLSADLAADLNGDGVLDNGDINAFVAAFLAGC